ncbi:MAG: hypothetical protein ACK5SP_01835 [bacterium]|jgi:hypothetical protein
MSTLRVSTIQDTAGSNSSTPAAIANGIAKAWVNFNGTGTVAIRAQYNVSSITDNGTGDYTVNLTSALADTNYCATVSGMYSTNTSWNGNYTPMALPVSASAVRLFWYSGSVDHQYMFCSINR